MTLCRHFGICGGCLTQDVPHTEYLAAKRDAVVSALARHGLGAEVRDVISVAPHTRRRAALKAAKTPGATVIGFHARKSHDIVDMQECRLLTPALMEAVPRLRAMMAAMLRDGEKAELYVTETGTGLDVALGWKRAMSPALTGTLAKWASDLGLARITMDADTVVQLAEPALSFGAATVNPPPRAFLQPTREGEAALQEIVVGLLGGAKRIADLFAGCGTFALPLAARARVHAVDLDRAMLGALDAAARHTPKLKPVTTEARDLFKLPLTAPELARFDAVLLDPPRAGALAQLRQLAACAVRRIAYVSCNPESFARDAAVLAATGYRLGAVTPVDQFLWSSHTELVAGFEKP